MITHAAVAAYISTFLAFVNRPMLPANKVVNPASNPILAAGLVAKYKLVIAPTSSSTASNTLMKDIMC